MGPGLQDIVIHCRKGDTDCGDAPFASYDEERATISGAFRAASLKTHWEAFGIKSQEVAEQHRQAGLEAAEHPAQSNQAMAISCALAVVAVLAILLTLYAAPQYYLPSARHAFGIYSSTSLPAAEAALTELHSDRAGLPNSDTTSIL